MANDSPDPGLRVSRRNLGSLGGGLLVAALAPNASGAPKKPPPGRSGEPATPLARRGCSVTALHNGLLLVAGGMKATPTSAVQLYDPHSNRWFSAPPLATARAHHAAVLLSDGRVLVAGGRFLSVLSSAEIYDPRSDEWAPAAPMTVPRAEHGAAAHGGIVLVTGGVNSTPLSSVELYDVGADAWRLL